MNKRCRSRVYKSRFTAGVKGSEIDWKIGDRARFVSRSSHPDPRSGQIVTILSGHTYNDYTPEGAFFRECRFDDGPELVPIIEDSLCPLEVAILPHPN